MGKNTDAECIARSIDSPETFEPVFDRHYDAIRRYAQRRLGRDAGEEVAAQVFLVAFERRETYDSSYENALPWLLGIAANTIRRYLRSARIDRSALQRLAAPPDIVEVMDAEAVDAMLASRRVVEILRDVPEIDREAFLMLALGQFTYEEISRALDIPVGTVRSKLHRVRGTLRERLSLETARSGRDHQ